jgi:hypothetical protein
MTVFWVAVPCGLVVYRRFRAEHCLLHQDSLKMEAVSASETPVSIQLTIRRSIPEEIAVEQHTNQLIISKQSSLASITQHLLLYFTTLYNYTGYVHLNLTTANNVKSVTEDRWSNISQSFKPTSAYRHSEKTTQSRQIQDRNTDLLNGRRSADHLTAALGRRL